LKEKNHKAELVVEEEAEHVKVYEFAMRRFFRH